MTGPNVPDNPDVPSIGDVAGLVNAQIDALGDVSDTREDIQELEAARVAATEAVTEAIGRVTALAALAESALVPKTRADAVLTMQAGAVFHDVSKGSAQESIHRAVKSAIESNWSAVAEHDDALVISQVAAQVAERLVACEVDLIATAGRTGKGLETAGKKLERRDQTVQRAEEFIRKIT